MTWIPISPSTPSHSFLEDIEVQRAGVVVGDAKRLNFANAAAVTVVGDLATITTADSSPPYATTTAAGIVELAEEAEVSATRALTAADGRLTDARPPLSHSHAIADIENSTANTLIGFGNAGAVTNVTAGANVTIAGGIISAAAGSGYPSTQDEGTPLGVTATYNFTGPLLMASIVGDTVTVNGTAALDTLTDVAITTPTTADVVRYNGSGWVNAALVIGDTTGLQTALNGKAALSHTHAITELTNGTANTLVGRDASGVTSEITAGTNITIAAGVISASGAGSSPSIQDEGTPLGTASTLNFVGSGVSASILGGVARIAVTGGALDELSDVVVATPISGQLIRYDGVQWVNAAAQIGDVSGLTAALAGKAATVHTHSTGDITGLGTAALRNAPASGNASTSEVVIGTDTRLTDARTPSAHTHPITQLTNGTANTLVGRNASGVTSEIVAGANISISGGVISASGSGGGGLPPGGTTNQVLAKTSATDYAVGWTTPTDEPRHIIQNASDASFANRATLQLKGATITDDVTNGRTIVTPIEDGDATIKISTAAAPITGTWKPVLAGSAIVQAVIASPAGNTLTITPPDDVLGSATGQIAKTIRITNNLGVILTVAFDGTGAHGFVLGGDLTTPDLTLDAGQTREFVITNEGGYWYYGAVTGSGGGGGGVLSFNGRTGSVIPVSGDYDASQITETSSAKILTDTERTKLAAVDLAALPTTAEKSTLTTITNLSATRLVGTSSAGAAHGIQVGANLTLSGDVLTASAAAGAGFSDDIELDAGTLLASAISEYDGGTFTAPVMVTDLTPPNKYQLYGAYVPRLLGSTTAAFSIANTTTETTVFSVDVPANTLTANGQSLLVEVVLRTLHNVTGQDTIRVYSDNGAGKILEGIDTPPTSASQRISVWTLRLVRVGTATCLLRFTLSNSATDLNMSPGWGTLTSPTSGTLNHATTADVQVWDWSLARTLRISLQHSVTSTLSSRTILYAVAMLDR